MEDKPISTLDIDKTFDPEFAVVESKGILATQIVTMIVTIEQLATKQAPTVAKYDVHDILFGVIASLENVITKLDAILECGIVRR